VFLENAADGSQQHSSNSNDGFLVTPALFQSIVTFDNFRGLLLAFNSRKRTLNKQGVNVNTCAADTSGFLLSGALVILRYKPRPRAEMLGSRKHRHVNTDFSDNGDRRISSKSWNGKNEVSLAIFYTL